MHSADSLVVCLGNLNEHISRHIDGYDGVHGEYGLGLMKKEWY